MEEKDESLDKLKKIVNRDGHLPIPADFFEEDKATQPEVESKNPVTETEVKILPKYTGYCPKVFQALEDIANGTKDVPHEQL